MKYIIWFLATFIFVYAVFYFYSVRKAKRDKDKIPVEVQYLILSYKLDIKKFSYKKFMNIIALAGSIDIALVATVVFNVKGFIWQLLFGLITLIPVIIISFTVVGKYYQKKQLQNNKEELAKEKIRLEKEKAKEKKKEERKKGNKKNG